MVNIYLVLAYGFVWGIFTFYTWVISERQAKLKREVAELKAALGRD